MRNAIGTLIHDFVLYTEKHYRATLAGDWREANKNARKTHKVFLRIVNAGEEAREALLELTENEVNYIALMAATYSLKYNTERSMHALKEISRSPGLIGFEAQQCIKRWEEGTWQLE